MLVKIKLKGDRGNRGVEILNRTIREGLTNKIAFEFKNTDSEGVSHVATWGIKIQTEGLANVYYA